MKIREKLVRDNILDLIRDDDKEPIYHYVSDDEDYEAYLRDKLVEEALEFQESGKLEELADIREVIAAICNHRQIPQSEIHRLEIKKRMSNGSFSKGIILEGWEDGE